MDFEKVFEFLIKNFQKEKINFALIGGFALSAVGYLRTTQDIDFLVMENDMPKVKQIMLSYGYEILQESKDVSNFVSKSEELGRVDFLHAHRSYTKAMLERAVKIDIIDRKFKIKVIKPEDLIGLKVQSSTNDPNRYHQDMADIESIIRANLGNLNMTLVEEYFKLFNRSNELKQILEKINNA